MAERDWGAEAGPLADRLKGRYESWLGSRPYETKRVFVDPADVRAAVEGLRLLARVTAERDRLLELAEFLIDACATARIAVPLNSSLLELAADVAAGVSADVFGWVNQSRTRWHRLESCGGAHPVRMTLADARIAGIKPCLQCAAGVSAEAGEEPT